MPNQFVKSLISFLFVLILTVSLPAQDKCPSAVAPKLLGLNLGMTPLQVQNVFGRDLKIKIKDTGVRIFFQNYINDPAPGRLHGVRALYLRFLDGRLYQIEVFYEDRADWQTLDDFTKSLQTEMNLAENVWQIKQNKVLIDCGEFTVTADKVLNVRVELTNKADLVKVAELRKK